MVPKMSVETIEQAIEAWAQGGEPPRARVLLFENVRDLPTIGAEADSPLQILRDGRASGSGKHALLAEIYARLGLPVRHVLCRHVFNDSPFGFPDSLQELLRKNEVIDVHHYLRVWIDGTWVDVDATWERTLRDYGFPVNEDWDGRSSMVLGVAAPEEELVVEENPVRRKEEILSRLSPRQRQLRRQFLDLLTAWIAEVSD